MPPTPKFPYLSEDVAASRAEAVARRPSGPPAAVEHFVASEVAINILGPQWWRDHMVGHERDDFFAPPAIPSVPTGYFIQHATLGLANDLLICQTLPGFVEQLDDLRTRSLAGVAHELQIARLLHKSGHEVQFVQRTGVKGSDYDLLVDGFVAVEAKAKDDNLTYSDSTLASTLKRARGQLPASGPGVIVLRIPDAWPFAASFREGAEKVITRAFSSSGRVNAVVVVWDEWAEMTPDGMACLQRFRILKNPTPRTHLAGLDQFITAITTPVASSAATVGFTD